MPDYQELFEIFYATVPNHVAQGRHWNPLIEFKNWDADFKLTERQECMKLGPPLIGRSYDICHLDGIEFRSKESRARRSNRGCVYQLHDGSQVFGEIQALISMRAFPHHECKPQLFAEVEWFMPLDKKSSFSCYVNKVPKGRWKEFARTHRMVLVKTLQRRNVTFAPSAASRPDSVFVMIENPHQVVG